MKITICQLAAPLSRRQHEFEQLAAHVREERSELLVLPPMAFGEPLFEQDQFDQRRWDRSVAAHDASTALLQSFQPCRVAGTRPVDFGNERYDEGFVWSASEDWRAVHANTRPADRRGDHALQWYHGAPAAFVPLAVNGSTWALLIGAELLAAEDVARYEHADIDLLIHARWSGGPPDEEWVRAGTQAAVALGAFCASSVYAGADGDTGWVIGPDGCQLARSSVQRPWVSVSVPLSQHLSSDPERGSLVRELRASRAHHP